MTSPALQDIDELVLACRNGRTRVLVAEAVACYKAGAYRACVVATWVAMMYDVIGKLEELETAGSGPARNLLIPLRTQATPEAERIEYQKFEREILEKLKGTDFELISHQEYVDLYRIFEDRHRCAHPSMSAGFEPYAMSAEQARTHLRNAITGLLQHPPAQGKFAKERIDAAIASDLFPEDDAAAADALRHGPLAHARPILIKAVTLGLVTDLLRQDRSLPERRRQFAGLGAVRLMHRIQVENTLASELNRHVAALGDDRLARVIDLVGRVDGAWHLLDAAQQARALAFIANRAPALDAELLLAAATAPELRGAIEARAADFSPQLLGALLRTLDLPAIVEQAVQQFADVRSFAAAAATARDLLLPAASKLDASQLGRVFEAYAANGQIYSSWGTASTLIEVLAQARPEVIAAVQASVWEPVLSHLDKMLSYGDNAETSALKAAILAKAPAPLKA